MESQKSWIQLSRRGILSSPGGSTGKESACNAGDLGSIPGLRRSPGEGNGNPLQDSCLENSMNRGAWLATVHGVAKRHDQAANILKRHFVVVLICMYLIMCEAEHFFCMFIC